jgi:hypothetical protein
LDAFDESIRGSRSRLRGQGGNEVMVDIDNPTVCNLPRHSLPHHSPGLHPEVHPVTLPFMPIAIMEESTGDQQDVSMEWMSSPPVSPQKNGNVLKRKAEEDLTLEETTHEGVEMEVAHDQEVVVDAKERPAVNGTPEDGKSARPHHSSLQSR